MEKAVFWRSVYEKGKALAAIGNPIVCALRRWIATRRHIAARGCGGKKRGEKHAEDKASACLAHPAL
jgi:hypothetical protein